VEREQAWKHEREAAFQQALKTLRAGLGALKILQPDRGDIHPIEGGIFWGTATGSLVLDARGRTVAQIEAQLQRVLIPQEAPKVR
jgi:hypothetical protein